MQMQWDYRFVWRRLRDTILGNELLLALCVTLAVIIVGVGFAYENGKLMLANPSSSAHYLLEPHNHLSFLANWDGRNYLDIAVNGYRGSIQANFFPLYPLLIRLVNHAIGSPLMSALLISWIAFIGAVYFYIKIVKLLYPKLDNMEALRAVMFFVVFPTSVFLFSAYTEGIFAFLALGAIYFALRKKPLEAGAFALLATAAHESGVFVVVLVALLLWEKRETLPRIASSVVIGCLGIVSYMVYLYERFGNPLQFVSSQKANGWLSYGHASSLLTQLAGREGLFVIIVIISIWYWWKKRWAFAVYSMLFLAIVLLGNLGGYGRYVLMDFPIQLMFYDYFRKRNFGYAIALAAFAAFWMYFLLQFAGGYTGG